MGPRRYENEGTNTELVIRSRGIVLEARCSTDRRKANDRLLFNDSGSGGDTSWDCKFVRVISHHRKSTCFSLGTDPDVPSAEIVASALLQLKNNPKLFKKWRKQPGYLFKANGKTFRSVRRFEWYEI